MINFRKNSLELIHNFMLNREMILLLTKKEVLRQYRGTVFGLVWSVFTPLFMLIIYTFIFSVVFKAKWSGSSGDSKVEFALILFIGLIIFNFFSESVSRAPTLMLANENLVKKVIFPLETLAWVVVGGAAFNMLISTFIWSAAYLIFIGLPPIYAMLFPIIFPPLIFITLGLVWLISSLGVYFRDLHHAVTVLLSVTLFLTPIFYSVKILPKNFQPIIYLNPLTYIVELARDLTFLGKSVNFGNYSIFTVSAFVFMVICYTVFQKAKRGFADVI